MPVALQTKNITKKFGNFFANREINFGVESSSIHALIGENGAGKSTLLKILFGLQQPDGGSISIDGKEVIWRSPLEAMAHGIGMVQQHLSLVPTLSAIDNILLGQEGSGLFSPLRRKWAVKEMENLLPLANLKVPWDEKVENLSMGIRQRIEILKLLWRKSKILLLDEPTSVLSPQEIEDFFLVIRTLKKSGSTIVIVTHKLKEVMSLCDSYTVLRKGEVVGTGDIGNVDADKIVELTMGSRLQPLQVSSSLKTNETILVLGGLKDENISRGSLRKVSLHVDGGEVVGIAGVDGSGQSAIVESILGLRRPEGRILLFGKETKKLSTQEIRNLGVSVTPENRLRDGIWPTESCYLSLIAGLEEKFSSRTGWMRFQEMKQTSSKWTDKMTLQAPSLDVKAESLSGGNAQKLVFAREIIGRTPQLLICHQPTQGVDFAATRLIHEKILSLREGGAGVLLISSDLDELMTLCHRIYVLFEGEIVKEFEKSAFDVFKIGQCMTGAQRAV